MRTDLLRRVCAEYVATWERFFEDPLDIEAINTDEKWLAARRTLAAVGTRMRAAAESVGAGDVAALALSLVQQGDEQIEYGESDGRDFERGVDLYMSEAIDIETLARMVRR